MRKLFLSHSLAGPARRQKPSKVSPASVANGAQPGTSFSRLVADRKVFFSVRRRKPASCGGCSNRTGPASAQWRVRYRHALRYVLAPSWPSSPHREFVVRRRSADSRREARPRPSAACQAGNGFGNSVSGCRMAVVWVQYLLISRRGEDLP